MKNRLIIALFVLVGVGTLGYFIEPILNQESNLVYVDRGFAQGEEEVEDRDASNAGRAEYFNRLLSDPVLKHIPSNIRAKELQFGENLKVAARYKTNTLATSFNWTEVGPFDVGGRTRAIAIDSRDKNIIIAGGASGGIWKSTDGGDTWAIKSDFGDNMGVTSVVQDPTSLDTWYYSTGEFNGNSAASRSQKAQFFGSGLFISTDNGESWSQIESTKDVDNIFNSQFDFISNVTVNPVTGSVFFSSAALGIFKATNNFQSISYSLGESNNHINSEVEVNANGVVIAALSRAYSSVEATSDPGVYISLDDGVTWKNIATAAYPTGPYRSVIGISESSPNEFYVLVDTGAGPSGMRLFYFNITNTDNPTMEDRTDGIPDFGGDVGSFEPQGGYNLVCKVSPSNKNIVFIGGTNLYRSTNGFSSTPPTNNEGYTDASVADTYWIGGYASSNDISQYSNHHPDQHNLVFDPTNSLRAYSAHDGGISVTSNILAEPVVWQDVDDGYNVTQFYTASIHPTSGDDRILGGTQDNGTPYFRFDLEGTSSNSEDASSGDGSFGYLGTTYAITSAQNGWLLRYSYLNKNLVNFSYASPLNATDQLFIHPFVVNPSNPDFVMYPEGNHLWRQNQMTTLPRNTSNSEGTTTGWTELNNLNVGTAGHEITALGYSKSSPSDRLYFAGSSDDAIPVIKRFDGNTATDGEVDVSISGADVGAYVHDIFVNPTNGDEVFIVISNYSVESLWHSNDGGANWAEVGGNLEGTNAPSFRAAAITPNNNGDTFYFVGTSIGLYVTDQLNGTSTVWTQVSEDKISNVVIADLAYRSADETLLVATHGRGMFIGKISTSTPNEVEPDGESPNTFTLSQNYPNPFNPSTNIEFTLAEHSRVKLSVYDMNGRIVASIFEDASLSTGSHSVPFDGTALASGSYLYRLEAIPISGGNGFQKTKSMTLIK